MSAFEVINYVVAKIENKAFRVHLIAVVVAWAWISAFVMGVEIVVE